MNLFIEWITRIVLFLLLAIVADALLPSGLMKKYARLVLSVLLLLIFLGPLLQLLKINPDQLLKKAEYTMNEEMEVDSLDDSIEEKKKEILQGQDAYKLEQVTQSLSTELKDPLKEQKLQLVDLEMSFLQEPYQMDTLDKLVLTLTPLEESKTVENVSISIMEKQAPKEEKQVDSIQAWVSQYLELDKAQIEIRWEEEDE
ncbi:stage III sporulation protein AF [Halobacillus halophilus]|uniref:Stage III sporulation protein AF n=1 Tax=Halobacillus halophilus (strain ATCC 35676 / DSM 2266 / JCM 20832 / KCTC 3685 / LMG 17431 / NBRC 102448 / NCIMB 2269) TaxID=866895 RepID=I0JNV8_HALH3|nr:stage III sporulation protein AF [Halobacillus halophilus]ASF39873.1 stage III sporulation protein AF [Halobacillus halophilus]CCG45828.1 stage III sporulation protein AF [Halobacillus halophilus DSM 2266]